MRRTLLPLFFATLPTLLACGGAPGSTSTKSAADNASGTSGNSGEGGTIGELAASEGGLTALGGGRNRDPNGGFESAMTGPLIAEQVDKSFPVKFDGVLREWHGRVAAKTVITGDGDAAGLAGAIQYDDSKIYIGAEIIDPHFSRTSQYKETEDHASLLLAFPTPSGPKGYQIGLFAGKAGEIRGVVRWLSGPQKGRDVPGAKIIEAPTSSGYTLEASVPWSAFPEAQSVRVGLRGQLRYSDRGNLNIVSTGPGDATQPATWSPLPTSPERAVIEGLLAPKGIANQIPKLDLYADVGGDSMKERISIFDRYLTICGPGYRGGNQFYYRELAGESVRAELASVTGRSKEDLIVKQTIRSGEVARERIEVWSILSGDEPTVVFSQEVSISSGSKRVTNSVRLSKKEIEVSIGSTKEWDSTTFRDATDADGALLLPWGAIKSRTYKFDGTRFVPTSEVTQKPTGQTVVASVKPADLAPPRDLPTPEVKKNTDLSQQVLEQYKKDRNVPDGLKPKADLQVQLDGDAKPERAVLIGKDIVVFGPGFAGGTRYTFLSLSQFADANDIQELTARDLTGNGHANLIVRGAAYTQAGSASVKTDLLLVYQVNDGALSRVFGIETARQMGDKRIQALVQFIPSRSGKGFDIDASPGIAKGWTKESYPWGQENGGANEPLLLPWSGIKNIRYTWNGKEFAR